MSKRIEKEPDGYIRDLQRKRRDEIIGIVGLNAFALAFLIIMFTIFLLSAYKPIPNNLITKNCVFSEYEPAYHRVKGAGAPAYFVTSTGEKYAIRLAEADDFIQGQTYEISYYVGTFYTWIYTVSDGDNIIISEEDQLSYREQQISELPRNAIICFGLYLVPAIPINIYVFLFPMKKISEINQKIEKRRAKRNKKE